MSNTLNHQLRSFFSCRVAWYKQRCFLHQVRHLIEVVHLQYYSLILSLFLHLIFEYLFWNVLLLYWNVFFIYECICYCGSVGFVLEDMEIWFGRKWTKCSIAFHLRLPLTNPSSACMAAFHPERPPCKFPAAIFIPREQMIKTLNSILNIEQYVWTVCLNSLFDLFEQFVWTVD